MGGDAVPDQVWGLLQRAGGAEGLLITGATVLAIQVVILVLSSEITKMKPLFWMICILLQCVLYP